jgi:hypothetical protein
MSDVALSYITEDDLKRLTGKFEEDPEISLEGFTFKADVEDLEKIVSEDDLDLAMFDLQTKIDQNDGGNCSIFFSGDEDPEITM